MSLWDLTKAAGLPAARVLMDAGQHVALRQMDGATTLGMALSSCRGRSVMIRAGGQLATALALLELDGVARRIVLCPPDLAPAHLPAVLEQAGVEILLTDACEPVTSAAMTSAAITGAASTIPGQIRRGECGLPPLPGSAPARAGGEPTEWLLFTSGTTGRPKMVVHNLASLAGGLAEANRADAVWSTFYDIRRYGGLQILLRALRGGGSMVLSSGAESISDFLRRAGRAGVTHISGTPTHWRRALMSPARRLIAPAYIRLSGEVVDQAILDQLRVEYPAARIAHAFASTEAGVAFDVDDGLAGFPAALIEGGDRLRVRDGSLQIRSARAAAGYAGGAPLRGADGFIDTGDIVELREQRYHFAGRREGLINVGGQKVHPEEVEAAINQHPAVQMSLVRGRASPIIGAIVVADVVLAAGAQPAFGLIQGEILARCRAALPAHKVPVCLTQVPALDIAASGKLMRRHGSQRSAPDASQRSALDTSRRSAPDASRRSALDTSRRSALDA